MPTKPEQVEFVNSKQPVLVANVLLRIERLDRDIKIDGKPAPPIYLVTGSNIDFVFDDDKYQVPSTDLQKAAGTCVGYVLKEVVKQGGTDVGQDTTDQGRTVEGLPEAVRDGGDIVTTEGRIPSPGPVSTGDDA